MDFNPIYMVVEQPSRSLNGRCDDAVSNVPASSAVWHSFRPVGSGAFLGS